MGLIGLCTSTDKIIWYQDNIPICPEELSINSDNYIDHLINMHLLKC